MPASGDESVVKLQSTYLDYLPALFRKELRVDAVKKKVWVSGHDVALREEEFNLLAFLYERQSQACSEEEIAANVKLESYETGVGGKEAIPQIVKRIREVIEPNPSRPYYLKTIDGTGYRLDCDEFIGRFLLIFENILKPIEKMVDNLAFYLDPLTSPAALLFTGGGGPNVAWPSTFGSTRAASPGFPTLCSVCVLARIPSWA